MRKEFLLGLLVVLLSISTVSAEIILSQPSSFYSLGDTLDISIEVSTIKSGFLEVNLDCSGESKNIYNSIISEKVVEISLPLTRTYIHDLAGQCKVLASYGEEQGGSAGFEISSMISVNINLDKLNSLPGQEINIIGEAKKGNGVNVNGFIELIIEGTDISLVRNVNDGEINVELIVPEDIEGKDYNLKIKVYEKLGEEITNQGTINKVLAIQQVPSKIDIIIDKQSITPGNDLGFRVVLYDQANKEISGDIDVKITNPEEDEFLTQILSSGDQEILNIESDFMAGYWTIEVSSLDVKAKRLFYVEENQGAEFKLENSTLIITNIGNVPYRKAVQIVIGKELEIREIDLDVGELNSFKLVAPDGDYDIKVTDGINTLERGEVSLTGNIIGVQRIREVSGALGRYPIVWIFLILVFGLFVLMIINKLVKKKFNFKMPSFKMKKAEKDKRGELVNFEGEAEHTLVLKGNKEEATILALKVGDKKLANSFTEKIIAEKGVVYPTEEYMLGIFTPSLTKTLENELKAVKIAREIEESLKASEVDFGLGINTGNIIAEKEAGKLKFTSLGNTLTSAKKIADSSKNELLLSEASSNKARNVIKTEKKGNAYTVKSIVDREKYKKFMDDFLEKNKSK